MTTSSSFFDRFGISIKDKAIELGISYNTLKNRWHRGMDTPKLFSKTKDKYKIADDPLYRIWIDIKNRCYNKNNRQYKDYGGRGIKLHTSWESNSLRFIEYIRDTIGDKPNNSFTLDRIDNNKGYVPGNLKWSTRTQQCVNRRMFKNNTTGYKNIRFNPKKKTYVITIQRNYKRTTKYANTLEKAIQIRNHLLGGALLLG